MTRHIVIQTLSTRALLELVIEKFLDLGGALASTSYSHTWFALELRLAEVLSTHRLAMQGFTVLHETIASMGLTLVPPDSKHLTTRKKDDIRKYSQMVAFPETAWSFEKQSAMDLPHLRDGWARLEAAGVTAPLHALVLELRDIRNGFNHAWTGSRSERAQA